MKNLSLALIALLGIAALAAAYTDLSLVVKVTPQIDGRITVQEEVKVWLTTRDEQDTFDYYSTLGEVPLTEWKRFSDRVGYHFKGPILNARVSSNHDYNTGSSVGRIVVEYIVNTSVVDHVQVGPRTTRYTLTHQYFSFDTARGGEVLLPKSANLTFVLPMEAALVRSVPAPSARSGNQLYWLGPIASTWDVEYEVEKPLTEEVNEYFTQLYRNMLSPGTLPLVVLVLALAGAGAFLFARGRNGKRVG